MHLSWFRMFSDQNCTLLISYSVVIIRPAPDTFGQLYKTFLAGVHRVGSDLAGPSSRLLATTVPAMNLLRSCVLPSFVLGCLLAAKQVGCFAAIADEPPYPPSPLIAGYSLDWATHRREAPGSDNWPMTWGDDDHQYTAWGDGGGFGGTNGDGRVSLGVARVEGNWDDYRGSNVWGGKNPESLSNPFAGKSYGMLSVDGVLYMWWVPDPLPHLKEARIAWSPDKGRTWQLADWAFTFEQGMTIPTFINFGKDHSGGRDQYVYNYSIQPTYGPGRSTSPTAYQSGFDVHQPGVLYLSRVPKDAILNRGSYEFFVATDAAGEPIWTCDIEQKGPVFRDPLGVGWNVSVSYNAGLERYLLCTEHQRTHLAHFGMFDAPQPWGPWTTVAYEDAWGHGHVPQDTFYWSLPTKWISGDGRDFTLMFTGRSVNDSFNTVRGHFQLHER